MAAIARASQRRRGGRSAGRIAPRPERIGWRLIGARVYHVYIAALLVRGRPAGRLSGFVAWPARGWRLVLPATRAAAGARAPGGVRAAVALQCRRGCSGRGVNAAASDTLGLGLRCLCGASHCRQSGAPHWKQRADAGGVGCVQTQYSCWAMLLFPVGGWSRPPVYCP